MISVNFVLLREGSSDDGLVPILRTLIIRLGAHEAVGSISKHKGSVADKLSLLREGEPLPDIA
ncbi:MAG: hypothetical protein ACLGIV_05075, partial [Actinomycetes bacterium]